MATRKEVAKAFDAGQAAQRFGTGDASVEEACPFPEGEERDAYMDGYKAELAEKWLTRGGRALSQEISN